MKGVVVRLVCLVALMRGLHGQDVRDPLLPVTTAPEPSSRSYFVLAPNTIRPGLPLSLSVSILDARSDVSVTATVLRNKGESWASATDTFSSGATGILTVEIPQGDPGVDHKLRVEGSGGLTFSQTQDLTFAPTSFTILVQTDKAIYKPGQTVHFRAMAVDPNLKPHFGSFDVKLKDPNDNIIQQWVGLENADYGVVSGKTVMSDAPVLGDWVLTVTTNNQEYNHEITIDEYVLPKFEVIVSPPSYVLTSDRSFTVTVEAKYTYGEPVNGYGTLEISRYPGEGSLLTRFMIDGKAEVPVRLDELEASISPNLFSYVYDLRLNVQANVTEELTQIQLSGRGQVQFEERPVKVEEAPGNPGVFKPGFVYTFFVRVNHVDGSPLTATERATKLKVVIRGSSSRGEISEMMIPDDGLVKIDASFDPSIMWPSIEVTYYGDGHGTLYKSLDAAKSETSNFLQIVPQDTDYEAGSPAEFMVKTTEAVMELSYQVFSKGSIVLSDTLTSERATTLATLSFEVTEIMAPKARLVVSYVRSADVHELILDSVDLSVNGAFQNEVTVGFDKAETKPGNAIKLDVTAEPNSYVGILAIDTSVRLLKTGNDITQDQVINALGEYDTGNKNRGFDGGCPFCRFFWWPFPTPGNTAKDMLDEAGILVFTDALVYEESSDYNFRYEDIVFGAMPEAAVPMADAEIADKASGSGPVEKVAPPRPRSNFPETWLWSEHVAGTDGSVTVNTAVPDTITSWVASAFSMSSQKGLGVAETPAKVTVFQDFFVSLTLPYSIIRGETFVLVATVFNYQPTDISSTVTLFDSDEFQIVTSDENEENISGDQSQEVTVPASSGKTVSFTLQPLKLGMVRISVRARSSWASDTVIRELLVEPEGIPVTYSQAHFIDLADVQGSLTKTFDFGFPEDKLVPGSVRAELTFTGDIMGPTISGLDKLLQMPSGCGEQTMLSFAPDVFIYHYLTSTNQNEPVALQKAIDFMNKGYQHELTYMHRNGAFSAFGQSDPSGSTWLTAFVVKSFVQAMDAILVDPALVQQSVGFLLAQQESNGVFGEPGRVIHTDMQGGVSSEATMTAYVLITLETHRNKSNLDEETLDSVESAADAAAAYLEGQFDSISQDVYALALVTYALTLGDRPASDRFLDELETKVIDEDGLKHWSKSDAPVTADRWQSPYSPLPSSDVEMTGYALLTYVAKGELGVGSAVARWLANQRNAFGGYSSTQDTVIGLEALSAFAATVGENRRDINVDVRASEVPDYRQIITLNAANSIVLQKLQLPVFSGEVTTEVTGMGTCLIQFSVFYNLMSVRPKEVFEVTVETREVDTNTVQITVCGKYVGSMEATGMAMMEVDLPSGFYADEDALKREVKADENLAKYETGRRTVALYLQRAERNRKYCYRVLARRDKIVVHIQPNNVKMYDYYKPAEQTVISYSVSSLQESSLCEVCPQCCGLEGRGPPGGGPQSRGQILLVVVAALLALLY